jgi:hypothetical protein
VTLDSPTPEPIVLSLDRTVDAPRRARDVIRALAAELGEERTEDATLRLVDSISDRWGVAHGSTIVWFEFDLG